MRTILWLVFFGPLLWALGRDRDERNRIDALERNAYPYDDDDPGVDVDEPVIVSKELRCPACGDIHLDTGEWYHRPHRTHLCLECGCKWRPFNYYTRGV